MPLLHGQVASIVDPLGRETVNEYNELGQLTKVTLPGGHLFESYKYDAEGRRIEQVDRAGRTNWTGYDALGRVIAVTNAVGTPDIAIQRTFYDSLGRVAYTIDPRMTTNAVGYDALDRQISVTNAWSTLVQQVTWFGYDDAGNQIAITNAATQVTEYQYDLRNRRFLTLSPAAITGGPRGTNTVGYDLADRRVSETDELGVITGFGYDPQGRLTSVTNAFGVAGEQAITRYNYDEAGNQTNQIDALTRTTTYVHDNMGRRVQRILPGLQSTGYGYDPVGNLLTVTNADNVVIGHEYDAFNRLTRRFNGTTTLETNLYADSGRITNRVDESGTHKWVYDSRDRLKINTTPAGTLFYTYDANGNQLSLGSATANGVTNQYAYDALNRLTNVIDLRLTSASKNTSYTFDTNGSLKTVNYAPITQVATYAYNSKQQLTNLLWTKSAAHLASFGYGISALGHRTNLIESFNGGSTRTYTWQYDQRQRLLNEGLSGIAPTGSAAYTLDKVGNRLTRTIVSLPGLNNQTSTYNSNDWTAGESYDPKGNTTNTGSVTIQYDWANRLTNHVSSGVGICYSADGNRIKRKVGGTTTWYLVATVNPTGYPQVVEESIGATAPTTLNLTYTYGLDLISQQWASSGTVYFFTTDGIGSTRTLTDQAGSIANIFTYDAYGTLIASNTTPQTAYLYTGEQFDTGLGMYYLRARYLRPGVGRFASLDTFEGTQTDPLSLHKYLYTQDNPINGVDPSGHESLGEVMAGIGDRLVAFGRYGVSVGRSFRGVINSRPLATLGSLGVGIGVSWYRLLTAPAIAGIFTVNGEYLRVTESASAFHAQLKSRSDSSVSSIVITGHSQGDFIGIGDTQAQIVDQAGGRGWVDQNAEDMIPVLRRVLAPGARITLNGCDSAPLAKSISELLPGVTVSGYSMKMLGGTAIGLNCRIASVPGTYEEYLNGESN